jgi:hypothetical protein
MLPISWPTCAFPIGEGLVERTRRRQRRAAIAAALIAAAALAGAKHAHGHGIVGNRFFPGTMAFDDPAVSDELAVSPSNLKNPASGGNSVVDSKIDWSFFRLLTPYIGVGVNSGGIYRSGAGLSPQTGFDQTSLMIKGLLYKNEPHETMISAALTWGIDGSGSQGVGANAPNSIQPGLYFGKGFGDAPDGLSWLRPFAVTGAISAEFPAAPTSINFGLDPVTSQFGPVITPRVETVHWGFALEYSTFYLTPRYTGGPPKKEPLYQLVPLVEFAFDTPRGQKTRTTMNPGLAYVHDVWQVSAEAIVPLNDATGRNVGIRAQLLLFLDDLAPKVFGKPLLSR